MKKFIAAIVAVVTVMSLSVVALAATPSATADVYRKVTIINGVNAAQDVKSVKDGGKVELVADSAKGKFDGWKIFKADGTAAVLNTDYTVVSGSADAAAFSIIPKTDLIVTGNYGGVVTDPKTGKESPKTGDFTAVYFGIFALAALGCGVASKKQLSK